MERETMKVTAQQLVDELLVMRCQDGDADAMRELVSRWQRPLWRYAYRLTGREDAAWDAVQDAWLAVIRGLRRLDDPRRFRQWAYRIVTNKAADWIRKRQRRRKFRKGLEAAPPPAAADNGAAEDVRAALRLLPRRQRVLLTLRYLEGLNVGEIASVLRVPTGTVKSRLHGARKELKRLLRPRSGAR